MKTLVLLAVVVFAIALVSSNRARKRSIQNADEFLDKTFSGQSTVSVKATRESLPYDQIVMGAEARGYRILSRTSKGQCGQTLVFTRNT